MLMQAAEAWEALGPWILEAKPEFGPGIKERFDGASKITEKEARSALPLSNFKAAHCDCPDAEDRKYLVCLNYWTLSSYARNGLP